RTQPTSYVPAFGRDRLRGGGFQRNSLRRFFAFTRTNFPRIPVNFCGIVFTPFPWEHSPRNLPPFSSVSLGKTSFIFDFDGFERVLWPRRLLRNANKPCGSVHRSDRRQSGYNPWVSQGCCLSQVRARVSSHRQWRSRDATAPNGHWLRLSRLPVRAASKGH